MSMFGSYLHLFACLALCHVMRRCFSEIREHQFEKIHLCSDIFPSSEIVRARSQVMCVARCSDQSTCTACSYFKNGTCHLHHDDVSLQTCQIPITSALHYRKFQPTGTPSSTMTCQNGGIRINSTTCRCVDGYVGDHCQRLMVDCTEGRQSGHYPDMDGFYLAQPTGASQPIHLRCDNQIDLFVLVRWQADISFNVGKALYVSGFGSATGDYWIGLEKLHLVTSNPYVYTLGIQVSNVSNDPFYQHYYQGFKVKGASEGYSMTFASHNDFSTFGLSLGDCLTPLKDIPFSTSDDDNDANPSRNCAADYGGGWWFNSNCSQCNVMGALRISALTRDPGTVDEVFWLPGLPADFSPNDVSMFLWR